MSLPRENVGLITERLVAIVYPPIESLASSSSYFIWLSLFAQNKQIGTIPQEPELFHRTIMENVKFARIDASDEDAINAAKKARCHDFIMELPEQYQSLVGERGVKLSGGQKQRITIARAFLKNAPILILDEATSALDSLTETEIHEALHQVIANKTTIVIAHRLSTLKDMDRILVFVNGEIVEDGSLGDLLKNPRSHFYKLCKCKPKVLFHQSKHDGQNLHSWGTVCHYKL